VYRRTRTHSQRSPPWPASDARWGKCRCILARHHYSPRFFQFHFPPRRDVRVFATAPLANPAAPRFVPCLHQTTPGGVPVPSKPGYRSVPVSYVPVGESRVEKFMDKSNCSLNFFLAWTTSASKFSLRQVLFTQRSLLHYCTPVSIFFLQPHLTA